MNKTDHELFHVWQSMITRCHNKRSVNYADWGGRGIRVCDEWRNDFWTFVADMGPRPDKHTLDRIDNDDDYCHWNCRWATASQQSRNTKRAWILEYLGVKRPLADWCEILDMNYYSVLWRVKNGWSDDEALSKPTPSGFNGI